MFQPNFFYCLEVVEWMMNCNFEEKNLESWNEEGVLSVWMADSSQYP